MITPMAGAEFGLDWKSPITPLPEAFVHPTFGLTGSPLGTRSRMRTSLPVAADFSMNPDWAEPPGTFCAPQTIVLPSRVTSTMDPQFQPRPSGGFQAAIRLSVSRFPPGPAVFSSNSVAPSSAPSQSNASVRPLSAPDRTFVMRSYPNPIVPLTDQVRAAPVARV